MADYNAIKYDGFSKGSTTLIKTLTASSSATLSFVDGTSDVVLDSTYKEYLFIFNNIHPASDGVGFLFQGNAAGGSGYDETITSTYFRSYHDEGDTETEFSYSAGHDQANGTAFQYLIDYLGNDNDQSTSGYLHIFNPSSTTFIKHFMARLNEITENNYTAERNSAGYFNTTSAIDEIQFKMSSGNIDAGTIQLIGIT
jgi:hypothetical protein